MTVQTKRAMTKKLQGIRVAVFENRRAPLICSLIERHGAEALSAPALQEIPLEKSPESRLFAEKLLAGQVDIVVLMTGSGSEQLLNLLANHYPEQAIAEALRHVVVVTRGPKPAQVLKEFGILPSLLIPEPNTWRDIVQALDDSERGISLDGKTVAIQESGGSNRSFLRALETKGARILRVPVYRWALPDDLTPLRNAIHAIISGDLDAALFTNANQAHHLFQVAAEEGVERELREAMRQCAIASIGPNCTEAIVSHGMAVDLEPKLAKAEQLIADLAGHARNILAMKRARFEIPAGQKSPVPFQPENPYALRDSVFMKACRLEKTPYTPVWLMRQAGRYMKEYRDLRKRTPFLELCKNKDLATEITVTAQEKIGADAAIIFSDILLLVESFGLDLEYSKHDGPVIGQAIRHAKQVDALAEINPRESLPFVFEAIQETRKSLKPDIPLIGFSGAPFTLASYMIEGGASKDFRHTKTLMYSDEAVWKVLMDKLSRAIVQYVQAQLDAGAQAIQLFDSWVGCLGPEEYARYVQPYSKQVINGIRGRAPVIHFGTGTAGFLKELSEAGGDVIGVDFRVRLDEAWKTIGFSKAIQGNLDPLILYAPIQSIKTRAKEILTQASARPGHIFNLGHGVLPETPVDHVVALVDFVHEFSRKHA